MKRASTGTKTSKKHDTSLLRWVKDINEQNENMIVIVSEENMHIWDVIFKPEMFSNETKKPQDLKFEFESDNGAYTPCSDETNEIYERLYWSRCRGDVYGKSCFNYGNAWYQAEIDRYGNMIQENMSTGFKRIVRKIETGDLCNDIMSWFAQNGTGKVPGVHLKVYFYDSFPVSPPFVRVVCPRFKQWTGHITIGGSMCTEMLTSTGWKSDITALGFLLQLKNNITEGNGKIEHLINYEYTEKEAFTAFARVARDHGWKIPSTHVSPL